jgi:hypothetical protein
MAGVVPSTLTPRFPHVAAKAGHYESTYLVATDPNESRAVWIRYTVDQAPGEPATGSIWFTLFEAGGATAVKVTVDGPRSDGDHLLVVGPYGSVRTGSAVGSVSGNGVAASWELSWQPSDDELRHLPYDWMYRAPLPRTKSTSPYPALRVTGRVTVADRVLDVTGWHGMLGHNWGAEHAHRWIWLRGALFAEQPDAWLDVVIGRIKVGPAVLPWIANGAIRLDGARHRVGGLGRRVEVGERPDGCDLVLPGRGIRATVNVTAPRSLSVGWQYQDPAGGEHQVRNCSVAGLEVQVDRRGSPPRHLSTAHGGVYELGTVIASAAPRSLERR